MPSHEGSGLAACCRAEPGMGEKREGRAGGPADYACGGYARAERTPADLPLNDQPWLITTP